MSEIMKGRKKRREKERKGKKERERKSKKEKENEVAAVEEINQKKGRQREKTEHHDSRENGTEEVRETALHRRVFLSNISKEKERRNKAERTTFGNQK